NGPAYFVTSGSKPVEPGESARVKLATTADNLFIVQQQDKTIPGKDSADVKYSFFKMNNEKKTITVPVTAADLGGYGLSWAFVKHNRFYSDRAIISVPWNNKDLQVEYASYRDKTLPGSEEKWKLRITGYKNEKAAAEL